MVLIDFPVYIPISSILPETVYIPLTNGRGDFLISIATPDFYNYQ